MPQPRPAADRRISNLHAFARLYGIVRWFHLGDLVGAATAGTNGDIAQITAPTGCSTWFTGRRVIHMDGR